MKQRKNRRPLSAGTVFMLILSVAVIAGSAVVLGRLSSGASVDLSKLKMNLLDLDNGEDLDGDQMPAVTQATAEYPTPQVIQLPAETKAPQQGENSVSESTGSFTLTVAGSLSFSDEIRKNCWSSDSKTNDYSDIMMLLKPELHSDVNIVFLENILSGSEKVSDVIAPESVADLLSEAGFNLAACGFSQAWAKGSDGIGSTWMALEERNIFPTGIRTEEEQNRLEIKTINGVKTAFLQYTGTVPSKTRKAMDKAGQNACVPEAEASLIASEIETARKQGAEAVIIMLKWGKTDKAPSKEQRKLAEEIAGAGADLIIGSGSRIPQGAEYLTGKNGKSVLCVWSLGSLLTGDRNSPKHMAGYLLHLTIRSDGKGGADILAPEYTPVYAWKYKQDGRYYYRCVASDRPIPDGMDSEQQKTMAKAETAVREALQDSPLMIREKE